jgi:predicted nucleotidyltransferase
MKDQTILSKELIKQSLVDNRETLRKYGVKRIDLFGSHVRGTATAGSDIDFIVELERLTLFLEDLFKKNVDLVTATSIKSRLQPYIKKEIEYATNL